ncbi:L,D-transpeptidase [Azotosporobacter soli]|uniref:L,D-transpeptidase n=1 Tax=Azotosporobacter soli TaxID=3055040 RepID=UPI0031FED0D8
MRTLLPLILALLAFTSVAFAEVSLSINVPEYALYLLSNGQPVKRYTIAVGTPYEQTPIGAYHVFFKERNPVWYPGSGFADKTPVPPGSDNPLGSRWMEFKPSYGIHGTNKPWSLDYPVSGGCIRMYDADAQELFEIVSVGTPVTVEYRTMLLEERTDGLYLKVLPDVYEKNTTSQGKLVEMFQAYAERYAMLKDVKLPAKVEFQSIYVTKVATRK